MLNTGRGRGQGGEEERATRGRGLARTEPAGRESPQDASDGAGRGFPRALWKRHPQFHSHGWGKGRPASGGGGHWGTTALGGHLPPTLRPMLSDGSELEGTL